jgi:tetratricopeptide (TPR) repeat protein
MLKSGKTFDENIRTLSAEIELAIRWGRPSILLAICRSKPSQNRAEKALEKSIRKLGQGITRISVDANHPDAAHMILENGRVGQSIFFVSNLDQGGGDDGKNAYRALNIYRELFVEQAMRCVFWLTISEASNLPKSAPDFWAFRHRVIEFASSHGLTGTCLPAGVLIWPVQDSAESLQDLLERTRFREELLNQLPDQTESVLAKIELLGALGYLYWRLGQNDKAWKAVTDGIRLADKDELSQVKMQLLNSQAILSYEKKEYQEASKIYKEILETRPQDGFLWMNLAVVSSALGKNSEAVDHSRKALRLLPTDGRLWNTMGHLYIWMGKVDEAIPFFEKAVELEPSALAYPMALAACYSLLGLRDESRREILLARRNSEAEESYVNICREAMLDSLETGLRLLKTVIEKGQMTKIDVRRDPVLNAILGDSLAEELL